MLCSMQASCLKKRTAFITFVQFCCFRNKHLLHIFFLSNMLHQKKMRQATLGHFMIITPDSESVQGLRHPFRQIYINSETLILTNGYTGSKKSNHSYLYWESGNWFNPLIYYDTFTWSNLRVTCESLPSDFGSHTHLFVPMFEMQNNTC